MEASIYGKVLSDVEGNEAAMGAEKHISAQLRLVQSEGKGTLILVSHLDSNGAWTVTIEDEAQLIYLQYSGNLYDNMSLRRPQEG